MCAIGAPCSSHATAWASAWIDPEDPYTPVGSSSATFANAGRQRLRTVRRRSRSSLLVGGSDSRMVSRKRSAPSGAPVARSSFSRLPTTSCMLPPPMSIISAGSMSSWSARRTAR